MAKKKSSESSEAKPASKSGVKSADKKPANPDTTTVVDPEDQMPEAVDESIKALLQLSQAHFGKKDVHVAEENERRIFGLPIKHVALAYLFDLDVIPMRGIINFAGPPKTYKTTTGLEVLKIMIDSAESFAQGAWPIVVDTEGKWSDSKSRSVLRHRSNRLINIKTKVLEEWQQAVTYYFSILDEMYKAKRSRKSSFTKSLAKYDHNGKLVKVRQTFQVPAVIPPTGIFVDSVTGAQSQMIQNKIMEEGHGGKTFQDRAMQISQFYKTWGPRMSNMPAMLLTANNLLEDQSNTGYVPKKVTPGGVSTDYHCQLEIRMKRIKTYKLSTDGHDGGIIRWETYHNSLGRDKRAIEIPVLETYDENDMQETRFDWGHATFTLLQELKKYELYSARLESVLGKWVEYKVQGKGTFYSLPSAGIDKEKAIELGLTSSNWGDYIENDEDLRNGVFKALFVQSCEKWSPDIKY